MYLSLKRVIDIAISTVLVVVLTTPILITFIVLKVISKDSVIYYSDRVGKNNHIFKMPKFRVTRTSVLGVCCMGIN